MARRSLSLAHRFTTASRPPKQIVRRHRRCDEFDDVDVVAAGFEPQGALSVDDGRGEASSHKPLSRQLLDEGAGGVLAGNRRRRLLRWMRAVAAGHQQQVPHTARDGAIDDGV